MPGKNIGRGGESERAHVEEEKGNVEKDLKKGGVGRKRDGEE